MVNDRANLLGLLDMWAMYSWAGLKSPLLATFASIALFSCATANDAPSENIYYSNQKEADAALGAFDTANPSCQLWTNWQKMCSRTGENGATYCVTDPDRPVRPSVPFCQFRIVHKNGELYRSAPELPEELTESTKSSLSRNRYCNQFQDIGPDLEYAIARDPNYRNQCIAYELLRPFNGMSLNSQYNPRCKKWMQDRGGFFYCAEAKIDDKCPDIKKITSFFEVTEDGLAAGREIRSEQFAIWGLSCIDKGVK